MIAQHGTLLLSAEKLKRNIELFEKKLGGKEHALICATVKANSYGHGIKKLLPIMHDAGIGWFCVYNLTEAMELAEMAGVLLTQDDTVGINILTLSPLVIGQEGADPAVLALLAGSCVRVTVTDIVSVEHIVDTMRKAKIADKLKVHVQVDTGLTRAGVSCAEAPQLVTLIENCDELELEGMFAHFSHGDEPRHATVKEQMERLWAVASPVKVRHPKLLVHIQNTGGGWHEGPGYTVAGMPVFNMARIGIGLYGLQPSTKDPILELQPIARVVAPVLTIHDRPAGVGVGYGHTFVTKRDSRLAIVPVGYADGYPRELTNKGVVQIRDIDCGGEQGKASKVAQAPLVGKVSMDQIIVDITDLPWVQVGHEVTVLSDNPQDANNLDRIADEIGTIGYELATHWGMRLKRCIV